MLLMSLMVMFLLRLMACDVDVAVMMDGTSKAHWDRITRSFPERVGTWRLREENLIVFDEDDAKTRRLYVRRSSSLKLREQFLRVGTKALPEEVFPRRHLPRSGSSASDTMPNVPMIPLGEIPRVAHHLKSLIFRNLTPVRVDDTEGVAQEVTRDTPVILVHHEMALPLCAQLLDDSFASEAAVYHANPGAGNMLIAAMRQNCYYIGNAGSQAHADYLLGVARREMQSNVAKYGSASLDSRLREFNCKVDEFYTQQNPTKKQATLAFPKKNWPEKEEKEANESVHESDQESEAHVTSEQEASEPEPPPKKKKKSGKSKKKHKKDD